MQGFEKIELQAGETKTVTIELDDRSFAYYNINEEDWHVESGKYNILVGASANDIRLNGEYIVEWEDDYTVNREAFKDLSFAQMLIASVK